MWPNFRLRDDTSENIKGQLRQDPDLDGVMFVCRRGPLQVECAGWVSMMNATRLRSDEERKRLRVRGSTGVSPVEAVAAAVAAP